MENLHHLSLYLNPLKMRIILQIYSRSHPKMVWLQKTSLKRNPSLKNTNLMLTILTKRILEMA